MRIECFQIDLIGEALREETMKGGAVVHLIDNGFLVVPPGFKKIPEVENPWIAPHLIVGSGRNGTPFKEIIG